MTNGNDLAHPTNIVDPDRHFTPEYHTGLTKREYFAAMALQGLLANTDLTRTHDVTMAIYAVDAADALINALNDKP